MLTINLNKCSDEILNQTVSEFVQKNKKNNNESLFDENKNYYFKVSQGDIIIIGKFKKSIFKNIYNYQGYFISPSSIKKVINNNFSIENVSAKIITDDKFQIYSEKIENVLSTINDMHKMLNARCNDIECKKILEVNCITKPNKDEMFTLVIDDSFIKRNKDKTFSELYSQTLENYKKRLNEYKTSYHENRKLIGKYYMTPNYVGYIHDMGQNSTYLIGNSIIFGLDYLTIYNDTIMGGLRDLYECSSDLYQKAQDILFSVKDIHSQLLIL